MPTSTLAPAIQWPAHFHPDHAPVHVVNDLFIPAPAEHIWAWLVKEGHAVVSGVEKL